MLSAILTVAKHHTFISKTIFLRNAPQILGNALYKGQELRSIFLLQKTTVFPESLTTS